MTAFNESQHDRDSGGKFTEMAGSEQPDELGAATAEQPVHDAIRDVAADEVTAGQLIVVGSGTRTRIQDGVLVTIDDTRTAEVARVDPFGRRTRITFLNQDGTRGEMYADAGDTVRVSDSVILRAEFPEQKPTARDIPALKHELSGLALQITRLQERQRTVMTRLVAATLTDTHPDARFATINPQSYPNLFDADGQRIHLDDETATRLRDEFDREHVRGQFEL